MIFVTWFNLPRLKRDKKKTPFKPPFLVGCQITQGLKFLKMTVIDIQNDCYGSRLGIDVC